MRAIAPGLLLLALVLAGAGLVARVTHAQAPTGYVEICKEGTAGVTGVFEFAIEGRPGTHRVAVGTCTPPIQVPAGRVTIREINIPDDIIMVDARTNPPGSLIAVDPARGTIEVSVPAGGISVEVVVTVRDAPAGWIEICKRGPGLSGTFPITYTPRNYPALTATVNVPVGACTPPIKVPAGPLDLAETLRPDTYLFGVQVRGADGVVRQIPVRDGTFSVDVPRGDPSREIIITVENRPGTHLKLCKVAGTRVAEGTEVDFTVTDSLGNRWVVRIPAGPAPGGFCKFISLPPGYLAGNVVQIEEHLPPLPAGYRWLSPVITIDPPNAGATQRDASITLPLAPGLNVVTFEDRIDAPPTRIKICKVAGAGVDEGTDFTFTLSASGRPTTMVAVPAGPAPGGYCVFAPEDTYHIDDLVTITETAPGTVRTTAIDVLPADRQAGPADLGGRSITIVAREGVTTVTFTNGR